MAIVSQNIVNASTAVGKKKMIKGFQEISFFFFFLRGLLGLVNLYFVHFV